MNTNPSTTHMGPDPYFEVRRHLQHAVTLANHRWREALTETRWADAAEAIGLALMGLPAVAIEPSPGDRVTCLGHVMAARALLEAIPVPERRREHLISAAYIQDAVRGVQAADRVGSM
jgi:hypothetical protein